MRLAIFDIDITVPWALVFGGVMSVDHLHLALEHAAAAAFDPERWTLALERAAIAGDSVIGQLVGASNGTLDFNWGTPNVPKEVYHEFEAAGGGSADFNPRACASFTMPVFATRTESDFISREAIRKSSFYNDFASRFELDFVCISRLETIGETIPTFALVRPSRFGEYEQRQRDVVGRLGPHFSAALRLQALLEGRGAELAAGALDALALPALIFDASGRLCASTCAGEAMLRRAGLIFAARGRVHATEPASEARLQPALQRACSRRRHVAPVIVDVVLRDRDGVAHVVEVAPLPWNAWSTGQGGAAVMAFRPSPRPANAAGLLQQTHGLTGAEAQVALQLAGGAAPAEIALDRGVSIETVRNQVKRVLEKFDVRSQAALVRRLAQLVTLDGQG